MKLKITLAAGLMSIASLVSAAQLDRVAVQVNEGVILQSEIDAMVTNVKLNAKAQDQSLPSDNALKTQVTERLILTTLQMQMAERMGLQVGDLQLDQMIGNIAQEQNMSVDQMREAIEAEGGSFAAYREQLRQEITLGEVQRIQVRRRIQVSPQEVTSLVAMIEEQGMQESEFHVGHILIEVPSNASSSQLESSKQRAEKTLELLKEGADFRRTAIAASGGPKALEGGDWGFMNVNEMPTLFAELMSGAKKDDILGPIKSGAGFHIVKVFDIRGRETQEIVEVNTRHILLKPSPILSEERAKEMLESFMDQVKAGDAQFEDIARQYSEDPGSALKGGELGWSDPSIYVPAFKDNIERLEPGEYSPAFRSSHGWHVLQVIDRRTTDATDQFNNDRAYQLIYRRKYNEELNNWLNEMRGDAYIEIIEPMQRRG
ncbi:chaperone SurA [Paraferrimonas sedimenticola]|uniref:Chaperone SurA n=2 Tax=Paraferrimonas sedimenticola TaxID=375674 RepID=A0AA37RXI1_9GAMM|nr:chaperone SurA [Paraferrimonas sedimenticola]